MYTITLALQVIDFGRWHDILLILSTTITIEIKNKLIKNIK